MPCEAFPARQSASSDDRRYASLAAATDGAPGSRRDDPSIRWDKAPASLGGTDLSNSVPSLAQSAVESMTNRVVSFRQYDRRRFRRMRYFRTALLWVTLLALAVTPAKAAPARRCKRLCRPLITSCVEAQACSALPTRHDRRSCKRTCKHQLISACKLDPNACAPTTTTTTTTTTLPGSCPGFTATCRATSDRSATGLGNRACVEGQGELPADNTTTVFVSIDASDPAQATINVTVNGSGFDYGVVCAGQATSSNGTLTVEQNGGSPYGTAGCCAADQLQLLHCRVTIDRLCAVDETILGEFEVDAQCSDATTCSQEVHFMTPRDS